MEKYENLGVVGEGSYGMVLKCRHKPTGQLVAIKKFLESEDDRLVKKIAMREVRLLKQLRHENLVNLIEVFRRKKRLYLVFEFVDHTVLDDLERFPNGLDEEMVQKILWQVIRGIEFCHVHNIIHRDIKPENILVSKNMVVKVCDFGFARTLAQPGESYTDYVATRWYRAPELLVGDPRYSRPVDIWAIGCLASEMLTGEPLFAGESDIDQLFHIVRCFGSLIPKYREIFHKNPLFVGMRLPEVKQTEPLEKRYPRISADALSFIQECLQLDADDRPTSSALLRHDFFTRNGFSQRFSQELKMLIQREIIENPLINAKERESAHDAMMALAEEAAKEKENREVSKKKAQYKEQQKDLGENKTAIDDKTKRKLPEAEKLSKKVTSQLAVSQNHKHVTSNGDTEDDTGLIPSSYSNTAVGASAAFSMPPIQHVPGSRASEKHMKTVAQTQSMMFRKPTYAASPLADKKRDDAMQKREPINLPEIRGAGAEVLKPKEKTKKSYIVSKPHINNLDLYADRHQNANSFTPNGDRDTLPQV